MEDTTSQDTYTAEQRETLESGLRILARMIARAHLRRQGSLQSEGASEESGSETGRARRSGQSD
ncbi:MAG: hypothetical protein F4Y50_05690 [Dehalococcoidia bacterium]|nr:hypothetical protein [Dehalococcoidia bacterium]